MGAKTFSNQTGHALSVTLTVRGGEDLGVAADVRNFTLANAQQLVYQYSGDDNPYLDGLLVYATDAGDTDISGKIYVFTRGDDSDNALNTNSYVTFVLQGQSVLINCSN